MRFFRQNLRISAFIILISVYFFTTAGISNDNGRAGAVGSPGETTCNTTNCHNSFAPNSGGGSVSAVSTMNNWAYEPFATYNISVTVAKSSHSLFGVGVEILTSSNDNGGTLIITDPVHTQIKSRLVSGVSRRNVVHTLNGGLSTDSAVFTFDWTAPDTSTGNLTIYFAGNASNGNGMPSGDYIYTSSRIITPSTGTGIGIDNMSSAGQVSVYPNPALEVINLHFNLQKQEVVSVTLYNLKSQSLFSLFSGKLQSGENLLSAPIPAQCISGLYVLRIKSATGDFFKKVLLK